MGRPRIGQSFVERHGDHWDIRIELPSGKLSRRACLPTSTTKEEAKSEARRLKEIAWRAGATLAAPQQPTEEQGETVEQWGARWWAGRKARGLRVEAEIPRWRKWILSAPLGGRTFGERGIAKVTREDVEDVVSFLDAQVLADALNWRTAANAWGLLSKALDDACHAKERAIRVRNDDPSKDVRGPDRGQKKAKSWLHPSEVTKVLACADVPLEVRRAIALNTFLYMRPGELRAIEWSDVDLEAERVSVHRVILRDGTEDDTKTEHTRKVSIEPALLPLLGAMREAAQGRGRVIELPPDTTLADVLRAALKTAGVDREELFTSLRTRKQIVWYDLRATGITWRAIRGDNPIALMRSAGHKSFSTTEGYIREAETVGANFGDVFPKLPAELFETMSEACPSTAWLGIQPNSPTKSQKVEQYRWVDRDSNTDDLAENADKTSVSQPVTDAPSTMLDASTAAPGEGSASLERALVLAAEAGRFDVVARLADELHARRVAGAGNVVALPKKRQR